MPAADVHALLLLFFFFSNARSWEVLSVCLEHGLKSSGLQAQAPKPGTLVHRWLRIKADSSRLRPSFTAKLGTETGCVNTRGSNQAKPPEPATSDVV
jgi:hypothetical protein